MTIPIPSPSPFADYLTRAAKELFTAEKEILQEALFAAGGSAPNIEDLRGWNVLKCRYFLGDAGLEMVTVMAPEPGVLHHSWVRKIGGDGYLPIKPYVEVSSRNGELKVEIVR